MHAISSYRGNRHRPPARYSYVDVDVIAIAFTRGQCVRSAAYYTYYTLYVYMMFTVVIVKGGQH